MRCFASASVLWTVAPGFAGLSPHPHRKDPDFQYKAMREGKQYFDVHAYHGHAGFTPFAQQIDRKLLPLRKKAGVTIPWYANETAVSAINGTDRKQAITLFKKLLFCWSRGAIGYNWYDLRNDGLNLRNPENTYGLVTFDFEAKPAAAVYHTLTRYFRGAHYLRKMNLPPGGHGYLFRSNKELLLATWNESGDFAGPVPVNAPGVTNVERLDCMGNGERVTYNGKHFFLKTTSAPAIYKITGASKLKCLEPEKSIILTTHRDARRKLTVYRIKLPYKAFGLSHQIFKKGIRFNLLLNDNDGPIRESYMQLYPGLSKWKNLGFFPLVVFE